VLLGDVAPLDAALAVHAGEIGEDFAAYRNHAYRVLHFCITLCPSPPGADELEKIAIAAALHDVGIWTDGTFDYLEPSIRVASEHLSTRGRADWAPEIARMILEHHKVSSYRGAPKWLLVEPFRRADWIDVTRGALTFGLPRKFLRETFARWPDAGFRRRLLRLALLRLVTHPWSPLPIVRL
jgi:HD domain